MYYATDLTWNQGNIFIYTVCAGMIISLVYCSNFSIKECLNKKKIIKIFLDVCFVVFSLFVMASTLYIVNRGIIKLYTVIGFILGTSIGYIIFIRPIKHIIKIVIKLLIKAKNWLNNLFG